ncbi:14877_t:CDS:2 [Gigaspora margarita]|uniref:14877_t:CDS:1 n=1 Tax=Gigaspora margarita TaxID=4874 RepID=A0ABN7UVH6_GIGMA|nr:14877_t:CDS:2 [Gigaspora margarita]
MTRPIENDVTIDAPIKYELLIINDKERKFNQDPEEKRRIKVNDERERREDINEGFDLLNKLLFPTTYYKGKASKAYLLKKAISNIRINEKRLTHLTEKFNYLQETCLKLRADLENVKM